MTRLFDLGPWSKAYALDLADVVIGGGRHYDARYRQQGWTTEAVLAAAERDILAATGNLDAAP
jgi:hypothetical protein